MCVDINTADVYKVLNIFSTNHILRELFTHKVFYLVRELARLQKCVIDLCVRYITMSLLEERISLTCGSNVLYTLILVFNVLKYTLYDEASTQARVDARM